VYKVLITGGNGFLGRNLINFLLAKTDYKIIAIVRSKNQAPSVLNKRLQIVYHDLRNAFDDQHYEEIGDVDYIIHFAGATNIKKSIIGPIDFVMDNILGTANLLEYVRYNSKKLKQFLYFNTAEVFGYAPTGTIFKEDDMPRPSSPYAASKIAAQDLCMAYKNTYNIPVIVTYAMNIFGPYQSSEKFIPLIIKKITKEEKVNICLNIEKTTPNRRNYLHVEDLCDAILFLFEHGISGEKYNISAESESDNLKIAQIIAKLLNKELKWELIEQDSNSLALPRLSGEKLYKLGWRQKKTLKEGLKEMIE